MKEIIGLKDIFEIIGKISTVIGIVWGIYQINKYLIAPKLQRTKIIKFYSLIKDWYNEIDTNLDNLNMNLIYNKENFINEYIKDNRLEDYKIIFSKKIRRNFLKEVGFVKEKQDDVILFAQYSRFKTHTIFLSTFWGILQGNFYRFYNNYKKSASETNFADVEMPIKLFKLYFNIKAN